MKRKKIDLKRTAEDKRQELIKNKKHDFGHDEFEQLGKLTDTLQALFSDHKFIEPLGHSEVYYTDKGKQIGETIAHASECFWLGNPVFEKIALDVYRKLRMLYIKKYGNISK